MQYNLNRPKEKKDALCLMYFCDLDAIPNSCVSWHTIKVLYRPLAMYCLINTIVGRAPARQSGGRRFKSRSSQFSLFILIYLKSVPSQFPLWFIT